jgi:hypothetical protein
MSLLKAFARGFASGWRKQWSGFDLKEFLWKLHDAGVVIFVWELMHGRIL